MALRKIKLGNLIELCEEKNSDNFYDVNSVKGISIQKKFIETKADMTGVSLKPYLIVKPDYFAYVTVTSRNSEKITLAHNTSNNTYIVSSSYVVFKVKRTDIILSDYLFIYFNRPEFDRFSRFNSWGSARETFDWETMCNIEIEVPSIEIQKKYVAIYNGMIANLRAYEKNLDDLKLVCDGYIEDLRRNIPCEEIGKYIEYVNDRNVDGKINLFQGIDNNGDFIEPKRISISPLTLKIVQKGDVVFNHALECVKDRFSFAYRYGETCVVSNSYQVFRSKDENVLLNKYIILWTNRKEFARYAKFISFGTAHENFEYSDLEKVKIPIPPISIQQSIVNILDSITKRKNYIVKLKEQIKQICPILIRGAVLEGEK